MGEQRQNQPWTNRILGAILLAVVAQAGGWIYWAGTINNRVDTIIESQHAAGAAAVLNAQTATDHEARMRVLEQRVNAQGADLNGLESRLNALEMHH